MEKQKAALLWLVHLLLLRYCHMDGSQCPVLSNRHLSCYNDFNHTMDCVWSDSDFDVSKHDCKIFANYSNLVYSSYWASCQLKSPTVATATKHNCSLVFHTDYIFSEWDELFISLSCGPHTHPKFEPVSYFPRCNIKVRVGKPDVNISTVSWSLFHLVLKTWSYELQWKRLKESWSEASEKKQNDQKNREFKEELECDRLILGETYEARVRMKIGERNFAGVWSDWSPTLTWVSPVGRSKQLTGHDRRDEGFDSNRTFVLRDWQLIVIGVAVVALVLIVVLHRTNKTLWVQLGKKIRGQPVPDPAKSFLQKDWLNSSFPAESFDTFLRPEIVSVEITSPIEPVNEQMHKECFNFSNPSYSSCFPPRSIAVGNLDPCPSDCSYGPVGQHETEEREQAQQALDVVFNERNLTGGSEIEELWKSKFERLRLQSLDSGVCVSGDVSQENIDMSDTTGHTHNTRPVHVYYDYECVEKSPTVPKHPLLECPLTGHHVFHRSLMERIALMSSSSVEPSGEGYMPVKQQH